MNTTGKLKLEKLFEFRILQQEKVRDVIESCYKGENQKYVERKKCH